MESLSIHGEEVPALGFGTYKLGGRECFHAVTEALAAGYRHIDTAEMYGNHSEVGEAIAASGVDRDEVFLTTKVWRTNLRHNQVLGSVEDGLRELGTDYVDLLLIHWPSRSVPVGETIGAMNELQKDGTVRHIGVSNFSVEEMREAMDASATPIVTNQVEYHPFRSQGDVLEFCIEHGVMLTAYSPLAKGKVADDDTLTDIGGRYGKTAAQVALRWLIQQEAVSAIPKASGRDHIHENIDVFDFELTGDEMERVFGLQGGLLSGLRSKLGL